MAQSKNSEFDVKMTSLARYAKALAHPARIAILEILAKKATCICGEIVEVLPLAQSTVSQHLKELKSAGLIRGRIDGLKSCYCLDPKAVKELKGLLGGLTEKLEKGSCGNGKC